MKRRAIYSLVFLLVLAVVLISFRWRHNRKLGPGIDLSPASFDGHQYVVVRIDLSQASLRLYWKNSAGEPFLTFDRLAQQSAPDGLTFAANAGIFASGYVPLGLHVEDGRELVPLNSTSGSGNFYLQPNGVFFIDAAGAHVVESSRYPGTTPQTRLATQSGPTLLIDGHLNPNFKRDSSNTQIRSAVGVLTPSQIVFVLSNQPVTFYQLATFLRDNLGCRDALYLDGAVSRFYPGEKPTGGVESNFAGILAIRKNGRRLQGR